MRLNPVLSGQFIPARGGQGHRLLHLTFSKTIFRKKRREYSLGQHIWTSCNSTLNDILSNNQYNRQR